MHRIRLVGFDYVVEHISSLRVVAVTPMLFVAEDILRQLEAAVA